MKPLPHLMALVTCLGILFGCQPRESADFLFYNGLIYTVDSVSSRVTAFAVHDGKIVETGDDALRERYRAEREVDLKGRPVYPGFTDAHAHFFGYATDLVKCNLYGTRSFEEVIGKVTHYAATNRFSWVLGRGWDQNDWADPSWPDKDTLDQLFPETPVYLMRIDGHAILVNQAALDIAGIHAGTVIPGGSVETRDGRCTGLLIDNAVDTVKQHIPPFPASLEAEALLRGQANCLAVGLTAVTDAGIDREDILMIDSLQRAGKLKLRDDAMISYTRENVDWFLANGPILTRRLRAAAFKLYADGALGSRGACLLEPYTDQPGHYGFMLHDTAYIMEAMQAAYNNGFQLATHCIGDSATRTVLRMYARLLGAANDKRWRIEHCQVVHPDDLSYFTDYGILPSVQPTHATSDMYWAERRLGPERLKRAYAYKTLLAQRGLLPGGSDFPVESINPLYGFYAAVSRRDQEGYPEGRFMEGEALTRDEALRAMTTWAAYACFEEQYRGSLEAGKAADFVILEKDIMTVPEEETWKVKVLETWIAGEKVFAR